MYEMSLLLLLFMVWLYVDLMLMLSSYVVAYGNVNFKLENILFGDVVLYEFIWLYIIFVFVLLDGLFMMFLEFLVEIISVFASTFAFVVVFKFGAFGVDYVVVFGFVVVVVVGIYCFMFIFYVVFLLLSVSVMFMVMFSTYASAFNF